MKVMLINPPIRTWAEPNCFPTGLGLIASSIRDKVDVEVLDINALRISQEEVRDYIKTHKADVFGIGGLITTFGYVKWLCEVIKENYPESKIIVGGSVATSIPDLLLRNTKADIAVLGEGEETIIQLIECLKKNQSILKISGIAYFDKTMIYTARRNPIEDLSLIPAYDLFPLEIYLKSPIGAINYNKWIDGSLISNVKSMNIFGTRGCPYQCIYCYHDFLGQGYRVRNPKDIIHEIKYFYEQHDVKYIHFIDDEFCVNRKFVEEFCKKMIISELGNEVAWGCAGRVNLADEELYKLMRAAGCINICYGIESGSQKMLDIMHKGVTVEQSEKALKLTRNIFGFNDYSIMIGMFEETIDTLDETLNFIHRLGENPTVFFATPYPGTQLYAMAVVEGLIEHSVRYVEKLEEQGRQIVCNLSKVSEEILRGYQMLMEG